MRSKKPFLIFWPQYFDAKRSRAEGRKIPKNLAIEKATPKEIVQAAQILGYQTEIEGNLRYPRTWWDDPGRVIIDTKGKKKSRVLLEVAKEIRKMRSKT
jgi:signal recognition particle subunit SRP19